MQKSRLTEHLLKVIISTLCLLIFGGTGIEAKAEGEVRIIREETGGLERLEAVEIPDECIEEWQETEAVQYAQNQASSSANEFLEYSSDYGYQDMAKRSNSEARQYAYQQLKILSKNFTVNGQDAVKKEYGQNTYAVAGTIDLSAYQLTSDEMVEIYFTFRHDNPQFFWLSNRIAFSSKSLTALTYDAYENGSVRQAALEEIVQTAQTVYQSQITDSDSNYEKVMKIHDALIADIEYSSDTSIPTAHSIAGAMTSSKSAVCEGYAKVMQVIMNQYGITNIYVTGTAGGGGHAWNMVRMNQGKYYWLDATWDDQQYEEAQHRYFLVGSQNFTDHTVDLSTGTGTEFLYELPQVSEENYVPGSVDDENGNIADKIAEMKVKIRPYNEENVKSSDKEALEKLLSEIEELLAVDGLSETETAELNQIQDTCECLLARIAEVGEKIIELIETVDIYREEKPEDLEKTAIEQTLAEIEALHRTGNLTDDEILTLDTLKEKCEELLDQYSDEKDFMPGDVNEDQSVDIKDLQLILRHVCEKIKLTDRQIMIADVVKDGKVDLQDLRKELRYVCGKLETLN